MMSSFDDSVDTIYSLLTTHTEDIITGNNREIFQSLLIADGDEIGYSKLSLYFTLALYVLSLPGLFSLVTRSVKVKPTQKTFDIPGPANPTAKPLRQTAAEIMAYFKALNYEPNITTDVITFTGIMGRSNSQAAFLTFCTLIALASAGLVLSILFPDVGNYSYLITLLSPYAGIYYWNNAQRIDEVQVKMETSDDEQITSIVAVGGKEDLERFATTLNLAEKGKVYVKGKSPYVFTDIRCFKWNHLSLTVGIFDTGSSVVNIPVPSESVLNAETTETNSEGKAASESVSTSSDINS